jgi:hypothetical protein
MRIVLASALAATALAFAGCGRTRGYYPVYGKIHYRGEPAAGAVVYFHRTGGGNGEVTGDVTPMAVARDDGSFELACDTSDGAPAGVYNVLVEWRPKSSAPVVVSPVSYAPRAGKPGRVTPAPRISRFTRTKPADRLNGRYFDTAHPLLTAEVKAETNNLPTFELTD